MKSTEKTYQAYLVRLWRDGERGNWRASAQDSKEAKAHLFADIAALIAFLEAQTTETPAAITTPARSSLLLEMPRSQQPARPPRLRWLLGPFAAGRAQPVEQLSLWEKLANWTEEFRLGFSGWSRHTAMVGSLVALLALVVVLQLVNINPVGLVGTATEQPKAALVTGIAPPAGLTDVVTVATSNGRNLVLKRDGTVVAWGKNDQGQAAVPGGLTGVIAIAAGDLHSLALKRDGTVVAWGNNDCGQINVPPGLRDVMAIVAGRFHSLALKRDGTVVAWGNEDRRRTPASCTADN